MGKIRSYLKLVRIHTACLTMAGAVIGALIGGQQSIPILLIFALWAVVFHAWGFLQNNLYDYISGYDLRDESKQHFPLVTGEITLKNAKILCYSLLGVSFIAGVWLANSGIVALIFLVSAYFFGTLYNKYSKQTTIAPLFITASFTSIPLFSYFSVAHAITPLILLVALYTFFLMLFEIIILGYMKDLNSDPVSLLKNWGTNYDGKNNTLFIDNKTMMFGLSLRLSNIAIAAVIWSVTHGDTHSMIIVILLQLFLLFKVNAFLSSRQVSKNKIVTECAIIEILTYWLLVFALQGALGWMWTVALVIFPLLWFMGMNYITWGTILRPDV